MKSSKVYLTVEGDTEKAYKTVEAGWIPKSAVDGTLTKLGGGKVEKIVGLANWLISKSPILQENSKKAIEESNEWTIKKFGTLKPTSKQIESALADRHCENNEFYNKNTGKYEKCTM